MKDRSLVFFTISAQMAVGAFLVIGGIYERLALIAGTTIAISLIRVCLIMIGLLIFLSLLASLFHLGNPQNAWRTLSNLRSSWLSREVLFTLLFAGLIGILILGQRLQWDDRPINTLLAGLAGLCGLALVYSMARVYMLRTTPAWKSWLTPASFFTTTFLLGCLFVGAVLAVQSVFLPFEFSLIIRTVLNWLGAGLILFLLVEFILIPLQLSSMADHGIEDQTGRPLIQLYLFRLVPILTGVTLVTILFFSSTPLNIPAALTVLAGFGLALTSEVFGRISFYESRQPRL